MSLLENCPCRGKRVSWEKTCACDTTLASSEREGVVGGHVAGSTDANEDEVYWVVAGERSIPGETDLLEDLRT